MPAADMTSDGKRAKLRKLLESGDPKDASGLRNEVALALLNEADRSRVLTCVYCGQAYPEGTPPWGSQLLTEHIRTCEKHPLRAAEKRIRALEGLLKAASHALRSYQHGNSATALAGEVADRLDAAIATGGEGQSL